MHDADARLNFQKAWESHGDDLVTVIKYTFGMLQQVMP